MDGMQKPNKQQSMSDVELGHIPWPLEKFLAVFTWFEAMITSPMDNWLKPALAFQTEDPVTGEEAKYRLNFLKWEVQLMHRIVTAYPDLPSAVSFAYALRFLRIQCFLSEHKQSLVECGLIRLGPSHSATSNLLLEVLCELPFTEERTNDDGKKEFYFSYDDILTEVERRASEKNGS